MIQFIRLRLSGFKSFVDPLDVPVEPGLTGIVGPNGCGKSNLVEALRWVMGESSAKQMRGADMDDVIFGGSSQRPPRAMAEVVVSLDNSSRRAPAQFNSFDQLDISRRIDRGQGSTYRVNGKETRARDVQLLFADAATGARSAAIVSQGKIGALISARPLERRGLLEDAAGISGLHGRRQEAEQRLKAAEDNLVRLDDVLSTLDSQAASLKRQARQAQRYRHLGEQIRATEARLLAGRWQQADSSLQQAEAGVSAAEAAVAQAQNHVMRTGLEHGQLISAVPPLRDWLRSCEVEQHRLTAERSRIDQDERHALAARRDLDLRLAQLADDRRREMLRQTDAADALRRIAAELADLQDEDAGAIEAQAEADLLWQDQSAAVQQLDQAVTALLQQAAAQDAERAAALRRQNDLEQQRDRMTRRRADLELTEARAIAEQIDPLLLTAAEMEQEEAEEHLEISREQLETLSVALGHSQRAAERARSDLQAKAAVRARLRAEADGLRALAAGELRRGKDQEAGKKGGNPSSCTDSGPALLEQISVPAGLETAVAAAFGDDLQLGLNPAAAAFWAAQSAGRILPPLPAGVQSLAGLVTAPAVLGRALAMTGLLTGAGPGDDLRHDLQPGQMLVSPDGALWRWDGLTRRAGAPSAAAVRLVQLNRLRLLDAELEDADYGVDEAEEALVALQQRLDRDQATEKTTREAVRRAESDCQRLREAGSKLQQRADAATARLEAVQAQLQSVAADIAENAVALRQCLDDLAGRQDDSGMMQAVAEGRAALAEARVQLADLRSQAEALRRGGEERRRRRTTLDRDRSSWEERGALAREALQDLDDRQADAEAEREDLATVPLELAERRAELDLQQDSAARQLIAAQTALQDAEQKSQQAEQKMRQAEALLAGCRESRIRAESVREAAALTLAQTGARIAAQCQQTPAELLAGLPSPLLQDGETLDGLEQIFRKLQRDRDALGAVNLRADTELAELEEQAQTLRRERDDLLAAIDKFRQAIATINREGRDKLLASFEAVDQHFRRLFTRLFGGGRAHLSLTDSSDPLQAGLEIMASPPGKRLQIMSLLSGGEQALTALALLFAVFMTNPAPICILDEVDAPLDDANVDRFCALVTDIARQVGTRFLVVTHHRMTMARMDRLYGVTMAERGVSSLVAVNLLEAVLTAGESV